MYIKKIHSMLINKEISCVELVNTYLSRIEKFDPIINSYIQVTKEKALKTAEEMDLKMAKGESLGLLEGIPMALKDNISTKDVTTTAASNMLRNYTPVYNATVYEKLINSPLLGKVNLDEFAMGTSTETSAFGKTCNPWDITKVPGGSSGGSVAAISARLAVFSLGSDTGGSIRQPAALCGVVGLKPTYGMVSRYGVYSLASSLDQVGPVTRTVEDSAYVLQQIKGFDPKEATSLNREANYHEALIKSCKGIKIGIAPELMPKGMEPEVKEHILRALRDMEGLGAQIVDITLPHAELGVIVYSIMSYAEAASNLARYDGVRYGNPVDIKADLYSESRDKGFGDEVKRRIMLGTYFLKGDNYNKYYLKAKAVNELIKRDFEKAFAKCDIIISPTSPTTAFPLGIKQEPHIMQLNDLFTIPVNLAGLPAMSIPCGFDKDNLPMGLHIIGNKFGEDKMFTLGHNYQLMTNHHLMNPSLLEGVIDNDI